jgi:hypothetical protein
MAISFVGSLPPVGANNGGNVTLSFSNLVDASGAAATLQQGDVVICAYASSGTADLAMSTSSSNWNEVTQLYSNGTIDTNLAAYWKVMGASPDTQFVAVGPTGASNGTIAVAMAFRGCDATPIDAGSLNTTEGTATSVPNPATTTPTTAGAWPVIVGAGVAGAGAAFTNPGDISTTTNHFRSANHPETNDVAIGIGIKTNWASGGFDPGAWGGGNVNAANSWAAISFALEPNTLQTLTPSLFTNTQTFHGSTVTPGTVTLSPSLATNTQSFFTATISASITLTASLFTNTQIFYAATVTQADDSQTLSPSLLTNTQTFYGPAISASIGLAASLLENTQVFYGPAVTVGAATLSPPLLVNISAFFESAITIDGKRFARRYPSNNFRNYMWRR